MKHYSKLRFFFFHHCLNKQSIYKIRTTKCWNSHALITLVACFGRIPRFCRFEPELVERLELRSSLIESISESPSSELLHGDNWSAKNVNHYQYNRRENVENHNDLFKMNLENVCLSVHLRKDQLAMYIQFDWVVSNQVFAMKSLYCGLVNGHHRQYYRLMMSEASHLVCCSIHWQTYYDPM